MNTKICSKCGIEKDLDEFNNQKSAKDGKQSMCRVCVNIRAREYRDTHKEEIKLNSKQYRDTHKEEIKQHYHDNKEAINLKSKPYRDAHKEEKKLYDKKYNAEHAEERKQYYRDNKEHYNEKSRLYHIDNKENVNIRHRKYYISHKEEIKIKGIEWAKANPGKVKSYRSKTESKRRGWKSPQPINSYFLGSHLHHLHLSIGKDNKIDHRVAIHIPEELHQSVWHANNKPETMKIINKLAFEWLATCDVI